MKKRIFSLFLCLVMLAGCPVRGYAEGESEGLNLTCKSAILMEASTGSVIYERNPDERLSPASITKIMTLILIFEALEEQQITLQDEVTTSAYAKSMGGSQVFLEEGEKQTVEILIKCIIIASGNDASVTMAEYISGTETEFVKKMNEKAKELGMENTNFEDCCGLTDSTNHYSSARDVAIMSRELIIKHPEVLDYSKIWMENITHTTNKGSSEFGLANTNKLLKQYPYATGLKTGSTSVAKYCLSATANKDGMELIAVVMAAPDYKARFSEAIDMLNYGYANCRLYTSKNEEKLDAIKVEGGVCDTADIGYASSFSYLTTSGENIDNIERKLEISEVIKAPAKNNDVVGKESYYLGDKLLGSVDIVIRENVKKAQLNDYLKKVLEIFTNVM